MAGKSRPVSRLAVGNHAATDARECGGRALQAVLELFPTVETLASASLDSVLAAWSGLGYYRRARMLHKAAQKVVEDCGGQFPASASELRELPGIGRYTAAAIASIAYDEAVAVVDGNVERVLDRLLGQTLTQNEVWLQAGEFSVAATCGRLTTRR